MKSVFPFKNIIILLFLLIISYTSIGQTTRVDSLKQQLPKTTGHERIRTLGKLSFQLMYSKPERAISYAQKSLNLLESNPNDSLYATIYNYMSRTFQILSKPDSSFYYAKKALKYAQKINYKSEINNSYNNIGLSYWKLDNYSKAIEYINKFIDYTKDNKNKEQLGIGYNNLGIIYYDMGDYDMALDNYFKFLEIAEEINKYRDGIGLALINIGEVYQTLDSLNKALVYFKKAKIANEKSNSRYLLAAIHSHIGQIYQSYNKIDSAKLYFNKAISLNKDIGNQDGVAKCYMDFGELYQNKDNNSLAMDYFNKALAIYRNIKNKNGVAGVQLKMAKNYQKAGNSAIALNYVKEALNTAQRIGDKKLIRDSYKIIYKIKEEQGIMKEAIDYYKAYDRYEDSIFSEKSADNIAKWQTRYQTNKKEKKIELLNTRQKLQETQIEKQNLILKIFIAGIVIIIFILFLFYRLYRLKRLANIELKKLSIVASKTDNLIVIANNKGTIEWINPALTRLYGYYPTDYLNKNIFEISTNPNIETIKKDFFNKKKSISYDSYLITLDNRKISLHTTITPILTDDKEIEKIIAVDSDITKQKDIEEKLKEQKKELKKVNATKDKFFSIIAHDLKNPFNTLLGLTEILYKKWNSMNPEKIDYFLRGTYQTSKKGYELLSNLLEWSRAQLNRIKMNPTIVDINKAAEQAVSMYQSEAEEKKIKLLIEIPEHTTWKLDYNMFTTITRNLINNAIKFTNKGGWIKVKSQLTNDNLYISVKDNGIGIPENKINKLFRIDERHHTVGTNKEKGTGLGLILCKEFVEKHNGEIKVKSNKEQGTEFILRFPKMN